MNIVLRLMLGHDNKSFTFYILFPSIAEDNIV